MLMPMPANFNLQGRVAIVTGGARGIGAAITAALARCGAVVAVWDRDPPPGDPNGLKVDVTRPESIVAALTTTQERHGRIDILVNNVGFAGMTVPIIEYPLDEWRRILEVNLTATFLVCQAVAPALVANGWGRIVNVASLAGKEGTPNASAYSAAKGGMLAFTKSLGKELAKTG